MARKIAAGNWKMNGLAAQLDEAAAIGAAAGATEIVLCPPATLLAQMNWNLQNTPVRIGGQDCHAAASGAHTGDISAAMLKDAGADYVILGHSERRADHGESDEAVNAKITAAWGAGLMVILCVGETEGQRDAGETLSVISRQIARSLPAGATPENTVVAYEPVWAIGTGRTATPIEIAEVHSAIRTQLVQIHGATAADIPLLYGGSVKPSNAAEIFAVRDVDGALVGGASLKAADFVPIMEALAAS